jgi:hypothetical protein
MPKTKVRAFVSVKTCESRQIVVRRIVDLEHSRAAAKMVLDGATSGEW